MESIDRAMLPTSGFFSDDDLGCGDSNGSEGEQRLPSSKIVHDPIHGQITLEPLILQILDTPQFQRLRDLKQLGCAYLVFPGASHNRFEHCIGVAHLAQLMLQHLSATQPELGITPHDILLVKIAGLCHDLGHGPFSHMFEEFLHLVNPKCTFKHEAMSFQMLEWIVQENEIDISPEDMLFISECINPYEVENLSNPKKFLYDVVANVRNSVDVDKFDYLARDCMNLGMSTNLKHDRLMRHCRVINDEICFNSKEVYNLYELFHTRYSLFKQVYSHRVSKSIEFMICDIFMLADPVLQLSRAIESPQSYAKLTDCILKEIEVSSDPRLEPAQVLIRRIRKRQLYKLIDETVLPIDLPTVLNEITPKMILDCHVPSRQLLNEDDLHVQNLRINYAMKDKNPVDSIKFFHKSQPNTSFYIPKHKVSHVIPQHFQERIVRVFLRHVTDAKVLAAQEAVRYFLEKNNCQSPPLRPVRSSSSPSALTATQVIRGASVFRPLGNFSLNGHENNITIQESKEEGEGEEEEGLSLSQGTAVTEEQNDQDDQPMTDAHQSNHSNFSVNITPYTGRSQSVLSRLNAASNQPIIGPAASSSPSSTAPLTPTRTSNTTLDSPPTIILDRQADRPTPKLVDGQDEWDRPTGDMDAESSTRPVPSTAAVRSLQFDTRPPTVKRPFTATASSTPITSNYRPPIGATPIRDQLATGLNVSQTPLTATSNSQSALRSTPSTGTPMKRRGVFKPATPVGKIAAAAAAAARQTPNMNRIQSTTPATQQLKKQKLQHPTDQSNQALTNSTLKP